MIQANELRLGNYIKTDDDIICIVSRIETKDYTNWNSGDCFSITALELNTKDDYLNVKNDKWQPIELTEEIVLKCGFVRNGDTDYYTCRKVGFTINLSGVIGYRTCIWTNEHIKHLHQLQNLYWCLTNEELNIEL